LIDAAGANVEPHRFLFSGVAALLLDNAGFGNSSGTARMAGGPKSFSFEEPPTGGTPASSSTARRPLQSSEPFVSIRIRASNPNGASIIWTKALFLLHSWCEEGTDVFLK